MASSALMNTKTRVLAFKYDLEAHIATRITRIDNPEVAPMGMADRYGDISRKELNY